MSWFNAMRRKVAHRDDHGKEEGPPPFPTLSTFLGLAAVMLVLWLLAYGPPHLFSASDHPVPSNNTEAGASK
ncbi:hypothetical protein EN962_28455 [Mesorhizobium sp. M7A.F.Ca.CA.001.09.2.1]|uniref:Uncharacterized protein n=3 Tax=Phyllobacteriaceae TaxID=69277 RepID=E8TDR2_MESCW|nr:MULTISPECIES: hypothetical protein [Mesorhizobium]ARP63574.1 hypothetical protein A9K65_009430 [Mesorhizobium sp. WSM1497]RUU18897.1 hypothetical protein EOC84_19070 [Mesorhizobium sp. Primo-B]RUU41616.1 hypothetical protein EOC83_00155 [Mesorhizobium sp. Primo-A]RUX44574.1 hypothetical protein EOA22_35580 [Mesorhizobium sp. M7A.F.Ca.US.014.04.1.1]RUX58063.1 hypothetical protein EN994_07110 [Mesorhizobium sp. M7A.F.Ca.CA.002.09.1.1]RUY28539.1 hypothetical protein EN979_13070 [Mesorhizobium